MNASEEPPPPDQKPGWLVRAFLIVLPVGLGFMVPLSLWIYYQKKHQPAPATSEYAGMLRKDLNSEDFARYARILSQEIGERTLSKPESLEAATSFIESTMGYENMGYAVQRQSFEVGGKPALNLVAELTGRKLPDEIVLVVARYDEADALGVAALMCVAHALAGTDHERTVRFAAVLSHAGGMEKLRDNISAQNRAIQALILVTSGASPAPAETAAGVEVKHFPLHRSEQAHESLARLEELKSLIERSADIR